MYTHTRTRSLTHTCIAILEPSIDHPHPISMPRQNAKVPRQISHVSNRRPRGCARNCRSRVAGCCALPRRQHEGADEVFGKLLANTAPIQFPCERCECARVCVRCHCATSLREHVYVYVCIYACMHARTHACPSDVNKTFTGCHAASESHTERQAPRIRRILRHILP